MATPADQSCLEDWLAMLASQRRLSPHTVAAYRRDGARLLQLSGSQPLTALSSQHIRRLVAQLHGQGLQGRSLARLLSAWRTFYHWLQERGLATDNPVDGVRPPRQPRSLPRSLSPDQATHLLTQPSTAATPATPDALCDQAVFELLYSSGLRLAELVALDVDGLPAMLAGEVRVLGKRNKPRLVPVGRQARLALAAWGACRAALARADEVALFVGPRGRRLSPRLIQLRLARRGVLQGMHGPVHPHLLRHSFASHVLQSSGDLRAVQEMLGHASIASTQVYTHLDFQHLAQVYDAAHPRAQRRENCAEMPQPPGTEC